MVVTPPGLHVSPFAITLEDGAIEDLRRRLAHTRWPERETVDDWSQGIPLAYVRELCDYWAHSYDFGFADRINAFPQFKTQIDGLGIHFLHVRSPEPDAIPLIITHGWPGSIVEFLKVIGPLTDPQAYGGNPSDAFHVVAPSLPGFGWSDKPTYTGWTVERIARAWNTLMTGLGYDRYGAQGGDWGSTVTNSLAQQVPEHLVGIHLNMAGVAPPDSVIQDPTPTEARAIADLQRNETSGRGYAILQTTRPQTLGYGLTDSPSGQLAWIAEKFREWTDCDGLPENALTRQEMLDDISVYWFTASATSSARICWENPSRNTAEVAVPTGISIYPHDIVRPSRRWAERRYTDIRWFDELDRGGHFAALEQPSSFVDQVRGFFRLVREVR